MRTSERFIVALMLGATSLAAPARAFDGAPVNPDVAVVSPQPGTAAALKKPATPATATDTSSISALEYAAEGGHPLAQWKLGRMYADGNGVAQNDLRAF